MEYLLLVALVAGTYYLVRYIRKELYFKSEEFLARKIELNSFVADHNEMVRYIDEIRSRGTFIFGASNTGSYSHLATATNTSNYKYIRDRNVATVAPHVHQCSLQVVARAKQEPIRYLMKYFGFKPDESTLQRVEGMGKSIAQLEEAVLNLMEREAALATVVKPPRFIRKHYMTEFMRQMGANFGEISIPYPRYAFEYVSAGGNSGQRTDIQLDSATIDALVGAMSGRIRFRKSIAGQRALMTTKLRNEIKSRDNYTCRHCSVSVYQEPHLLLEVDHVVPISKGGMTAVGNLQTLCWKCNRRKSNKIVPTA